MAGVDLGRCRREGRRLFAVLSALVVVACAGPATVTPPGISLDGVRMEAFGPVENQVAIDIRLKNRDRSRLRIRAIAYELWMNGRALASGRREETLELAGLEEATLSLPVAIRTLDLVEQINAAAGRRSLAYALIGSLEVEGIEGRPVPFRSEGALFLPDLPLDGYDVTADLTAPRCGSGADGVFPTRHKDKAAALGCGRSA